MPFFSNKFSPKKIPARKSDTSIVSRELGSEFASRELGLEIPPIKFKLGDQEMLFEDGQWIPEFFYDEPSTLRLTLGMQDSNPSETGVGGSTHKENLKLRKSLKILEEENNLLKLKFEILLDMLTQTTAESQIQIKEIEQLKYSSEKSSSRGKKS